MLMGRMFAMALAAVGLSVGGFELGKHRVTDPSIAPLELPADHPLAVALQPAVAQDIAPQTRESLYRIAENLSRDQNSVKSGASPSIQRELDAKAKEMALVQRRLAAIQKVVAEDEAKRKEAVETSRLTALRAELDKRQRDIAEARRQMDEVREEVARQTAKRELDRLSEKYGKMALDQMTPELQERVKASVRTRRDMDEERGFGLLLALRNRDALNLTPHQVTQLQLLQSEFIRRFAPIREAYESRVDALQWRYEGDSIVAKPGDGKQATEIPATKNVSAQAAAPTYFVEYVARTQPNDKVSYKIELTSGGISKDSSSKGNPQIKRSLWQYPRYVVTRDFPKGSAAPKNSVVRYFVWPDDASLERKLVLLKEEIDTRAKAILTNAQRKSLQEMIDRSLASGK